MSLDSFFDTLDTDTQFNAWKISIKQKLSHLRNNIPTENKLELRYIDETLELINNLTLLNSNYVSHNPDTGNKNNIIERLKACNSYHKRFGYK